jgi:hypothetical protein
MKEAVRIIFAVVWRGFVVLAGIAFGFGGMLIRETYGTNMFLAELGGIAASLPLLLIAALVLAAEEEFFDLEPTDQLFPSSFWDWRR